MTFQEDYIDLLADSLTAPTIRLPPVAAPWRSNTQADDESISTLRSLMTRLFHVDWFDLYRVPKSKESKESFKESFTHVFNTDDRVKHHIAHIIKLEIEAGILKEEYKAQRYHQLNQWLYEHYFNQLHQVSNTYTSTLNHHQFHLKLAYMLFAHILPHIFKDGIWIHKRTFYDFLKRVKADPSTPVLLLPNHKSHIDYIIIHVLYVRFQLETPLVIAGENLNVPIFGTYLKRLGAIFIKRKFSSNDFWYIDNMKHLMNWKFIKPGQQLELFIEGTRSRNGKLMLPKTGFMQLIKDSIDDANVQPISLIYEKPYEFKEYLVELNGMDKTQESFTSILSAGTKLLFKSDNYGKLIIKFHDGFLKLQDYPVKELNQHVLQEIHQVSYITEISIIGLSMSIIFYKQVHVKRFPKLDVILLFKQLAQKLVSRCPDTEHLIRCINMPNDDLINLCDQLINKFLKEYITIDNNEYMIMEETALVYYKNSLLNNFISEMFLMKSMHSTKTMTVLKRLFEFEFLTSTIDESIEVKDDDLFINLLNPFIESYELVLNNLKGVIKISLKNWLHLLYLSSPNVSYKESMNKSNILYAIYTLQSLKLIKLTKEIDIEVLDEDTMIIFKEYLHCLRTNTPLKHSNEVFQKVSSNQSHL